MLSKVLSAAHFGLETIPIEVEVNIFKKGFPGFSIIGLPSKAIDEARERVKTALANSAVEFPQAKIIVNLAPTGMIPTKKMTPHVPVSVDEIVKDIIDKKIDKYSGKEANANQRGLLRGMLEELFAGEVDAEKKYRSVSMYLTGEDSTSSMSGAQVIALLDWIKPSKDDGGAYFSDPMAIKEAHQIEHAVLLDAGQTELPV